MPTLRNPAASRSPSCWRGCKPARPEAADAGAVRTEAKTTARFASSAG
jgi:hypothetical protein